MLPDSLRADCAACHGLCCVAPAFDAWQGFGFDKPAHRPCPLLRSDYRCSIHGRLAERGFPGCAAYDCHGAGQWVTQRFCNGVSWRDSPQQAREIFAAFRAVRAAHELMAMLTIAIEYAPGAAARGELRIALKELETLRDAAIGSSACFDLVRTRRDVMRMIRDAQSRV